MSTLPTNRTVATPDVDHVNDHNELHRLHNELDGHPAAADPHGQYQKESEKDQANGYMGLDAGGLASAARLGTGSATGTAVLHGDRVWRIPVAGITIQDENGPVASGVTQIDFQGEGISVAVGTGEVVVTVSGGAHPDLASHDALGLATQAELNTVATTVPHTTKTANHTLALVDAGTVVEMDVASANTVTIPPDSSVNFPIDTVGEICQIGAGQTTIVAGSGVTLRSAGNRFKIAEVNGSATYRKRAANDWLIEGNLVV